MKQRDLARDLWRTRTFKVWAIYITALFIAIIATTFILRANGRSSDSPLSKGIIDMANFPVYFYKDRIPANFTVEKDSISLTSQVLFIRMANDQDQLITITQQALPPDLTEEVLQATEDVPGADGKASITVREGQLTGNLLTADKKTLVIVNTTDNISIDTMKVLLRELTSLR